MRTLVIGDIHGNYNGLIQALERSNFNYNDDLLISLGDVVDGHSDSFEVVEELLKIKNLIAIKGNHDEWFNHWIRTGINLPRWKQGQDATGISYLKRKNINVESYSRSTVEFHLEPLDIPKSHRDFFENQKSYYIDDENNLFVHGGFNRHYTLEEQLDDIFWWDRDLWSQALSTKSMTKGALDADWKPKLKFKQEFNEIFIGHTSTQFWGVNTPMNACNIWNLDTGGGWYGYVSIMDVETKEFWQSDDAKTLYPEFKGRK